jgi:tetratricopeptide (TPR) repeat protein
MFTVDRQPSHVVSEFAAPPLSSLNQQVYTRLKLALGLNLRGQVYVVVCDDGPLRHRLAAQLADELNGAIDELLAPHAIATADLTAQLSSSHRHTTGAAQPVLVSLNLNLPNPNILQQVNQWLTHHSTGGPASSFQIIGIEQLTREPVQIQRAFLDHLQTLGKKRLALDCNLVLWMSRPWRRSIQQFVPEFWRWHTAVFEFEGDPTPTIAPPAPPERLEPTTQLTPRVAIPAPVLAASTPVPLELQRQPSAAEMELADLVIASVMQAIDRPQESAQSTAVDPSTLDSNHPQLAPLHLMQQIEDLYRQAPDATALATAYHHLADWYRSQIEQGYATTANLMITIRAYEQVLQFLPPDDAQVPELLNDVGNLYWMLSRGADVGDRGLGYLQQAIAAYQQALNQTEGASHRQSHAMIQNNLGSAYGDLARYCDASRNLQLSIQAYQAALQYQPTEAELARYAATQNNLGTAYWNLAQHEQPIAHLQKAIAAYNEALRYYDPEQEPLHFGMIQNNLGTAYWNLAQCDSKPGSSTEMLDTMPEDFLRLAIGAYRVALVYRTQEVAPAPYAATQNNLGTAYWHLANQPSTHYEDYLEFLKQAITAYREAIATNRYLTISGTTQAPSLTFDIWATHNNLGLACYQLGSDSKATLETTQRADYLTAALQHHVQAFHGWAHNPDLVQAVTEYMAKTVRAFYEYCGLKGQTQALSQIPPNLLPTVMKQL